VIETETETETEREQKTKKQKIANQNRNPNLFNEIKHLLEEALDAARGILQSPSPSSLQELQKIYDSLFKKIIQLEIGMNPTAFSPLFLSSSLPLRQANLS